MEHLGRRVIERVHELSSIKRFSLSLSPPLLCHSLERASFEICKYTPFDAHNSRYAISRRGGGGGGLRRIERCNSRRMARRPEIHIAVRPRVVAISSVNDTWTPVSLDERETCKVAGVVNRPPVEFWPRFWPNRTHYRTDSLYRG